MDAGQTHGASQSSNGTDITVYFENINICVIKNKAFLMNFFPEFIPHNRLCKNISS